MSNFEHTKPTEQTVALRKESVDRNMLNIGTLRSTHSRSPQGERG